MNNHEKLVIVSGGGRGLGLAIVKDLLDQGYCVASFSRNTTQEIEALLKKNPSRLFWKNLDATDYAKLQEYIQFLIKEKGNIYGLVNNAAIATDGVITLVPHETIHNVIKVNLEAVLHLIQLCTNQMLLQKDSVILNVSSIIGNRGYSGLSVYSATKAGLDGITRSLARELGPRNIRVNSIAPGYLETEMSKSLSMLQREQIIRRTPLGRLGTLKDITALTRFLLSSDAQFISGQVITVDGGLNC